MDNSQPVKKWEGKRVRTPTVLQMEATECGAASLGMILGHYGRIVPLEELRLECGVTRDGSKASNVVKAARKYGLSAKGFRKEPEGLRDLALPMILFWNFNHFVVLEGIKKGKVFLNDPGMGPRTVTEQEFEQAFTGVVLAFELSPEFKKGGVRPSLAGALRNRLAGARKALTYVVLAGLFLIIPGLVLPIFSKIFVDEVLIRGAKDWIKPLLLGMGSAMLLQAGLIWLQNSFLLRFETKLSLASSARFFHHVFRLPIQFFTQRFGGEIGNRVIINDRVAQLLSGELAGSALSLVMIVFYAVLMIQYDVVLTLIGILIALSNLAVLRAVSRKRKDLNQRVLQEEGKLLGATMSGLQMIESLKASGRESDFFSQWSGYQTKVLNAHQKMEYSSLFLSQMPVLLMGVNTVAILVLGGFRVMGGYLSMGMLIAFQSLMASFLGPVNRMVQLGGRLQQVDGDMKRLDDVFKYPQERQFSSEQMTSDYSFAALGHAKLSGNLEFINVTFGYCGLDEPLIENFNLTVKPGSRVALVGGSGSGKSTVARLAMGFYEPWSGEILFDGKPRSSFPRSLMVNSLAAVDQDIVLFEGTIRENLTMLDGTLSEAWVIKAAKDANIHDEVTARLGGFDAQVAEGGGNFSGGQRQRLEIARALLSNPSILVMDEATSALDPTSEKIIGDNIRRRGCACLIIAHRLSTIRDCDEIIVMERGKVVERGTHEEMVKADGPYARLIGSE